MAGLPDADILVTEEIVRSLLEEQIPDLAGLPLLFAGEGFDNHLWRLGESHLVRLPRRRVAVKFLENEIKWLPQLAKHLTIPAPVPLRVGRPSDRFAHPWIITSWFEGEPADAVALEDEHGDARRLAEFLRALHVPAPPGAPVNQSRCIDMADRDEAFEREVVELRGEPHEAQVSKVWQTALSSARWSGSPVWIHGDLHPGNMVVRDGVIAAVVDFGDTCASDPAIDLAGAWMLFSEPALGHFLETYGASDAELIARALGWAALFGLFARNIGNEGPRRTGDVGRRTLERVVSYSTRAS